MKGSDNLFPKLLLEELGADAAAPAAGALKVYAIAGRLYSRTSAGVIVPLDALAEELATAETDATKVLRPDGAGGVGFFTPASGFSDPMTTRGDIIVRNASNVTARLGRGSASQVLTSDGTDVAWQTPSGSVPTLVEGRVLRTAGDLTTTSTTFVDITSLSITLTTGARSCLVGFSGNVYHGTNQSAVIVDINIDGTRQGGTQGLGYQYTVAGNNDVHLLAFTYLTATLTAASHTFKAQWRVGTGTGNLIASSGAPAVLWVKELLS